MTGKPVKKSTRKAISKKVRFEVFKRDHFTCQYCGRKAPDVILQVDHIKPVAKGGKNDLLNLVTSCIECNQGKGKRELSDDSVVRQQQKQAEILAARIEQIEMLRDWHIDLAKQSNAEIEAVNSLYTSLTNGEYIISDTYKNSTIRKLVSKYGLSHVLESLSEGAQNYGNPHKALDKLPGICACRNDPVLGLKTYILNIMNKHLKNFDRKEASIILDYAYSRHGLKFYEAVKNTVQSTSDSWRNFKNAIENAIKEWDE